MVHSTFAQQQGNVNFMGVARGGGGGMVGDSGVQSTTNNCITPSSSTSPLGIPKSPSFHSGLDLMASASVDSLIQIQSSYIVENTNDTIVNDYEPSNLKYLNNFNERNSRTSTTIECVDKNGDVNSTTTIADSKSQLILSLKRNLNNTYGNTRNVAATIVRLPQLTGNKWWWQLFVCLNSIVNFLACFISLMWHCFDRCSTGREGRLIYSEIATVLRHLRFRFGSVVGLEMEGGEEDDSTRIGRIRVKEQRRTHRTDLWGKCQYGELNSLV